MIFDLPLQFQAFWAILAHVEKIIEKILNNLYKNIFHFIRLPMCPKYDFWPQLAVSGLLGNFGQCWKNSQQSMIFKKFQPKIWFFDFPFPFHAFWAIFPNVEESVKNILNSLQKIIFHFIGSPMCQKYDFWLSLSVSCILGHFAQCWKVSKKFSTIFKKISFTS